MVYSTVENFAVHMLAHDSVVNGALNFVTRCLPLTPTEHLPIYSGVKLASLCQLKVKLSLCNSETPDFNHLQQVILRVAFGDATILCPLDIFILFFNFRFLI